MTFVRNHRDAIAAMDFFTVPTLTFRVLYCFFVIGHDRRKILCFNITRNPNPLWIVQQRDRIQNCKGQTSGITTSVTSLALQP